MELSSPGTKITMVLSKCLPMKSYSTLRETEMTVGFYCPIETLDAKMRGCLAAFGNVLIAG